MELAYSVHKMIIRLIGLINPSKKEVVVPQKDKKIVGKGWGGIEHSRAKVITFPQSEFGVKGG